MAADSEKGTPHHPDSGGLPGIPGKAPTLPGKSFGIRPEQCLIYDFGITTLHPWDHISMIDAQILLTHGAHQNRAAPGDKLPQLLLLQGKLGIFLVDYLHRLAIQINRHRMAMFQHLPGYTDGHIGLVVINRRQIHEEWISIARRCDGDKHGQDDGQDHQNSK